jgi:hypothetical protein
MLYRSHLVRYEQEYEWYETDRLGDLSIRLHPHTLPFADRRQPGHVLLLDHVQVGALVPEVHLMEHYDRRIPFTTFFQSGL